MVFGRSTTLGVRVGEGSPVTIAESHERQRRRRQAVLAPVKELWATLATFFVKGPQQKQQQCLDMELQLMSRDGKVLDKNATKVPPFFRNDSQPPQLVVMNNHEAELNQNGDILETLTHHSIAQKYPESIMWNDPIQSLLCSGILQPATPYATDNDDEETSLCSISDGYDGFEFEEDEDELVIYGIPLDQNVIRSRLHSCCSDVDSFAY